MKTLLSQFCDEFDGVVRPLLQPLTQAADTLNHVSDKTGVRSLLPTVLDVRHHLSTLADKVAEQQAYVLIFGPLKSGKSTLMNAISAAYVSEVTTLPAYPCMVYVSHADKIAFTVTRYNGQQEEFGDMASMRTLLEWAHNELADRIREVEARNQVFDPNEHIPQAIRRIDVKLPARHLEESSAVLVDTPGLYSRMKFGYDRMTREFRNTASSAIFVVKTDNLFLEQVFDEFGDLLKLFSRIFLVVNVDSTKRDLLADGELGPSLECHDPDRIITAFENLSMTAPLKAALKDGRLKIYPVDLLRAASERVKGRRNGAEGANDGGPAFKAFINDLTEYLNSTDYLVAFLGDSLKQAWGLLGELRNLCQRDSVKELGEKVARLQSERDRLESMEQAVERLGACDWDSYFGSLGDDLASIARGRIEKLRDQTSHGLGDAMDAWFEGDASFQNLVDDLAHPLLARSRDDLAATARGVLETVASTDTAGAQIPEKIRLDLSSLGLDLGLLGKSCLKQIDPGSGMARAQLDVSTARIPVKKGFLDYLCLRSQGSVRRRLFGPEEAPTQLIARAVKARRLGSFGHQALQDAFEAAFARFFDGALEHLSTQVLKLYAGTLRMAIKAELRKIKEANALRKASVDRRLAELSRVSDALESLSHVVEKASVVLGSLSNRYGETDPSLLVRAPVASASIGARSPSVGASPGARPLPGVAARSLTSTPPSAPGAGAAPSGAAARPASSTGASSASPAVSVSPLARPASAPAPAARPVAPSVERSSGAAPSTPAGATGSAPGAAPPAPARAPALPTAMSTASGSARVSHATAPAPQHGDPLQRGVPAAAPPPRTGSNEPPAAHGGTAAAAN